VTVISLTHTHYSYFYIFAPVMGQYLAHKELDNLSKDKTLPTTAHNSRKW